MAMDGASLGSLRSAYARKPPRRVKLSYLPAKMAIAKAATFGMALRRCSANDRIFW